MHGELEARRNFHASLEREENLRISGKSHKKGRGSVLIGTQKLLVYSALPRSIILSIAGEGEVYRTEEKELKRVGIKLLKA